MFGDLHLVLRKQATPVRNEKTRVSEVDVPFHRPFSNRYIVVHVLMPLACGRMYCLSVEHSSPNSRGVVRMWAVLSTGQQADALTVIFMLATEAQVAGRIGRVFLRLSTMKRWWSWAWVVASSGCPRRPQSTIRH